MATSTSKSARLCKLKIGALDASTFSAELGISLKNSQQESPEIRSEIISTLRSDSLSCAVQENNAIIDVLKHVALLDTDEDIRSEAANALASIGDEFVIPALEEIAQSQDGSAASIALGGLNILDEAKALELCKLLALESGDCNVRETAVGILDSIGDKSAIPTLLQVLNRDDYDDVVAQAAIALGNNADGNAVPPLISCFQRILQEVSDQDMGARLNRVPESAYGIIRALGNLEDERAVPPFEALIQDPGQFEQNLYIHIARALGQLGQKSGVQSLLWVLQLPDSMGTTLISGAAEALGELGDNSVIPELQKLLAGDDDAEYPFHVQVALALTKLGDTSGVTVLVEILMGDDISRSIESAQALLNVGYVEPLRTAHESHSEEAVRERCQELLETSAE